LEKTLDSQYYPCPIGIEIKFNLCCDKGYFGIPASKVIMKHNMIPHVRSRGEEKKLKQKNSLFIARRWVVERTHSWLNRFRKLAIRYEKL